MDCRLPGPLSMRFPREEYRNGLPFPSPWDFPSTEVKPMSPALAGRFFTATAKLTGKPIKIYSIMLKGIRRPYEEASMGQNEANWALTRITNTVN